MEVIFNNQQGTLQGPETGDRREPLLGYLDGSMLEHLPLAQGVTPGVLGSGAQIGLPAWSLLLSLPVSLPLISVSHE